MHTQRLGCLSGTAMLATILTLLIVGGVALVGGSGMFSAGSLNAQAGEPLGGFASHAEIGNACARCHAAPWSADSMADRCASCHTGLSAEYQDLNSLHGRILQTTAKCRLCHPEHRGPTAALTELGDNFPHDALGFSLRAHATRSDGAPFTCADCHTSGFATAFDPAICLDCHSRIDLAYMEGHGTAFGAECLACHDGLETIGKDFDHARVPFVLTGAHLQVDCAACHQTARSLADLRGLPQDCYGCHERDDNHQGRFGSDCARCHTTTAWKPATFDHSLAAFSLTGAHVTVACENCHIDGRFQGTPSACFACHEKDDRHQGRFGADCARCHTTKAWKPATFDHSLAAFPLTGAHVTVACEACHPNGRFQGTPADCIGCHQKDDNHQGRYGTDCAACHSTDAWKPATFDHARSRFQLTGAHANVACERCHPNGRFQGTPLNCSGCHEDPSYHRGLFGTTCDECHTVNAWSPAVFNRLHSFPINHEGASTCRDCHTVSLTIWTCAVCHPDSQIAGKHREEGITNFSDCLRCHPTGQEGEGGGGGDD